MNIVAEISMYPLQSDYIPPIDDFHVVIAVFGYPSWRRGLAEQAVA